MSSSPPTLLEDPPSQEVSQSELCMICMCQPREIRLCCGHLFACAECLSKLTTCALCREPITTGYYVQSPPVDDENSLVAAGYISSGSETYASMDDWKCSGPDCGHEATHRVHCSRCATTDGPVSRYLCNQCLVEWTCPVCQQPCGEEDVVAMRSSLTVTSDSEGDPEAGSSTDPDSFTPIQTDIEEMCFGRSLGGGCKNLATFYFQCHTCGWGRCVVCQDCTSSWSCPGCSCRLKWSSRVLTGVYDGPQTTAVASGTRGLNPQVGVSTNHPTKDRGRGSLRTTVVASCASHDSRGDPPPKEGNSWEGVLSHHPRTFFPGKDYPTESPPPYPLCTGEGSTTHWGEKAESSGWKKSRAERPTIPESSLSSCPVVLRRLVHHCVGENTIVGVSKALIDAAGSGCVEQVALQVTRVRLTAEGGCRKAVFLAPTVKAVHELHDDAARFAHLRQCQVIGNAEVDSWDRRGWLELIWDHDLLITTPQLFLDVLKQGFLELSMFGVVVFYECRHCSSRGHPYAGILAEHHQRCADKDIRILGFSGRMEGKKPEGDRDTTPASQRLEMIMRSRLLPDAEVRALTQEPFCGTDQ